MSAHRDTGTDPSDPEVRALAERWGNLTERQNPAVPDGSQSTSEVEPVPTPPVAATRRGGLAAEATASATSHPASGCRSLPEAIVLGLKPLAISHTAMTISCGSIGSAQMS